MDCVNAFSCGLTSGLGGGFGWGILLAEFGLMVCYVLCEIVDAHFG